MQFKSNEFWFTVGILCKTFSDYLHHSSNIKLNPYFLTGIHYNMYNNDLTSSLGDWQQDISVIPDKWQARVRWI